MQKSYWREFTKQLGAKLGIKLKMLAFAEREKCRFVDIQGPAGIARLYMDWNRDGSSSKPVTEMWAGVEATQVGEQYAIFDAHFKVGRFAIWENAEAYADNWAEILLDESRDDGFKPFGVLVQPPGRDTEE